MNAPRKSAAKEFIYNNKFLIFFVLLLLFLLASPLLPARLEAFFEAVVLIVFLASPFIINPKKKILAAVSLLALVGILTIFVEDLADPSLVKTTVHAFEICAYFAVIIYLLWHAVTRYIITKDLIFATLCGYFLIGIGFYFAYSVFQELDLVAFTPKHHLDKEELIFYSLSSLNTLGMSEFMPASPLAKRLTNIEAATGVLYIAVFIGRLIGLYSGSHIKNSK